MDCHREAVALVDIAELVVGGAVKIQLVPPVLAELAEVAAGEAVATSLFRSNTNGLEIRAAVVVEA
jgi:hypothetical protein